MTIGPGGDCVGSDGGLVVSKEGACGARGGERKENRG